MSWESLWSNRCSDGFGRRFWTQGPQFWAVHRWIWQKMLMTCNKFDAKYLALNHWISAQWNHWPSILEEHSTKHLGRGWNGVLYFQTKAEDGWAAGGTPDFGNVLFSDCKGRLFVAWFMIVTRSVEKCVASWCMMIHACFARLIRLALSMQNWMIAGSTLELSLGSRFQPWSTP